MPSAVCSASRVLLPTLTFHIFDFSRMAEPILTKCRVKHPWVKGFRFVHIKRAGSTGNFTMDKKGGDIIFKFKKIFFVNYKWQSCNISSETSLGHEDSSLFKSWPLGHKRGHARRSKFNICLYEYITSNIFFLGTTSARTVIFYL